MEEVENGCWREKDYAKLLIYPYNASDLGASIFSCVNGE